MMEAVFLVIWFGTEMISVPMPDRASCEEARFEYPAGITNCSPLVVLGNPTVRDDTCLVCIRQGLSYDWQRPW